MHLTCLAPSEDLDYKPIFTDLLNTLMDIDLTVDVYYAHCGELPDDHATDSILITGSEFHVYDRQDWVTKTQDYIKTALKNDIPVLGVCYGHQLLADTLGGTVTTLEVPEQAPLTDREMGYNTIRLTDAGRASTLFRNIPEQFISFTSHRDYVAELPDHAVPLAANPYGNHGFTSTRYPAYGIQFHPEYDLDLAETLLEQKDLPPEQHNAVEETLTEERARKAERSRTVFTNFLTLM